MIDMNFFRTAATVIPTLLIAVVFTGKVMETFDLDLDKAADNPGLQERIAEYLGGITFVSWLLFAAIVGEGAALAAIISDTPHLIYLVLVLGAMAFLLTSLAGTVLIHAINRLDDVSARRAMGSYSLIFLGLVVFLSLISSAVFAPEWVASLFG